MSLINQMLKDLDKRQGTVGGGQPLSVDVRLSAPPRSGYGPILLLALVVVAAGAGGLVWNKYRRPSPQPSVPQVVMAANPVPNANPVPVPLVPASGDAPTPSPSTAVTPAAAEAVAKSAAAQPAATRQTAQSEVAAIAKDSASSAVTAARDNPKLAREQGAAKPGTVAMKTEKTIQDFAGVSKQNKPMPSSFDSQASSFKVTSPQQRADNFYRQAVSLIQQSRVIEAQHALRQAIGANPENHGARQLLAGLLVDAGRNAEAASVLRDGVALAPGYSGFTMALARLQVAAGTETEALATLEQGLTSAGDDAEYHAFFATLLQNQGRHAEAVQHYITALRSNPAMPKWLVGVGISLQAENKLADAAEAFQRAINTAELSPELTQFADQHLEQIHQQR